MRTLLETLRDESRLVGRIAGREILDALNDLHDLLLPHCGRSRLAPTTIIAVLARQRFACIVRGRPGTDALSISAVARSLELPFETVRRHVRQLEQAGWVAADAESRQVRLPDQVPPDLEAWCASLGNRLQHIVDRLQQAALLDPAGNASYACPTARILAALDLVLSGIETTSEISSRKLEQFVIQLVVSESAGRIAADLHLSRVYGSLDIVPPEDLRRTVTVEFLAARTSLSPSTIYRLVDRALDKGVFERVGGGVRATHDYLAGDVFAASQRALVVKIAQLLEGLSHHSCHWCSAPPADRDASDSDTFQSRDRGLGEAA